MEEQSTVFDIYISYNSNDIEFVLKLKEYFESQKLRIFLAPHSMDPMKDNWIKQNGNHIETSKVFLLILSSSSDKSVEVGHELYYAEAKSPQILVLAIDDIVEAKDSVLMKILNSKHILNPFDVAYTNKKEDLLKKMISTLSEFLNKSFSTSELYISLETEFIKTVDPQKKFDEALQLFYKYQLREAIEIFKMVDYRFEIAKPYIGFCLYSPPLFVKESSGEASKYFNESSALGAFGMAEIYSDSGSKQRAIECFNTSFAQLQYMNTPNEPFIKFILGLLHYYGFSNKKREQDYSRALALFEEASLQGVRIADYWAASMYDTGVGRIKKNIDKAKKHYELAAQCQIENAEECLKKLT